MARLVFLGSPSEAATCLAALVAAGHEIALVVTPPDRRRARGTQASGTPVKSLAWHEGIPVSEHVSDVLMVGAEVAVLVAFGEIVSPTVLSELLFVNLHFSLLPRWRGAAPVERAILAGDHEIGVCLMKVCPGLDTGPVFARRTTEIGEHETAAELRSRLSFLGADLLVEHLARGRDSLGEPTPQEGEATYAKKIETHELHLDWKRPATELERLVRVGRAWTCFRGHRLLVADARAAPAGADDRLLPGVIRGTAVGTAEGELKLLAVQPAGRRLLAAAEWRRGARLGDGESFS